MVSTAVAHVLGFPKSEQPRLGLWVGRIWDPSTQQLEPCFGNFPPAFWATAFRYGQGIAGHAFRNRGPAVYGRPNHGDAELDSGRRTRLLYAESRHRQSARRWIVEIPILVTSEQPAIGTIGFSDEQGSSIEELEVSRRFAEIANSIVADYHRAAQDRQLLDELTQAISHLFWLATHDLDGWARDVLDTHWKRRKPRKPPAKRRPKPASQPQARRAP
jgi:hypothetical protein